MKQTTTTDTIKEFREKFELHDLGKDEFTICTNNGDGTCNGGVSIEAIEEKSAEKLLDNLEQFLLYAIQKTREETKWEVIQVIQDYFKGLILIPDAQATKERLLDVILDSLKEKQTKV